ncbi:MAG: alpha/beta fold hydrolase [Limnoraphis robusta]|jgi:pimeloyl-ACP methyl ester carboxylesterase
MMSRLPDVLWLNTSPSLRHFDQELVNQLSQTVRLGYWEYRQTLDEPSCLNTAVTLVHDYLKSHDKPIHLIGHSTGGLLGLMYAQKYPERVKSLTLLSVGVHPTVDWKAHYYVQLQLLPCSRQVLLEHTVETLFGYQKPTTRQRLMSMLDRDLTESLSVHSLMQRMSMTPIPVSVPLMACGSEDDVIVDDQELQGWRSMLKPGDRVVQVPQGGHFFHHFFPQLIQDKILNFWSDIEWFSNQGESRTPMISLKH